MSSSIAYDITDSNLEKRSMADCGFRRASSATETWSVEAGSIFQTYTSLWTVPVPQVEILAFEPDFFSEMEDKEKEDEKRLEIMYSLVNKTLKRWGSIPIRGFNQTTITSKFQPVCEKVLRGMASRLTKKSQEPEILPAKHQPVVGSTAFSSRPSGGGQSSPDTCGDGLPTQGHASAATAGTIELPSSAFNNKSSVADQKHYQKSEKSEIFLTTASGSKPNDSGDEDHVIQVEHQSHDSATFGSRSVSNSSSVVVDQKPYKNEAIFPDKYGPGVGSTAFRSLPSGGEQSSSDGGGEDHIIEVHYQGHDSAVTAGSSELASPALNNTPSASDQSTRASFLLENRDDDEQPPPDRSATFRSLLSGGEQSSSDGGSEDHIIELHHQGHDSAVTAGSSELASSALNNTSSASDQSTRASSLLENRDDDEQPPPDRSASDIERGEARPAERRLNPSSVAKTCLFVSCEVCIAPSQIRYNASTSLSPNANILLLFAEVIGVAGFLLCLGACFFQRKHRTSGVMTVMGCVATICGLLSILGTRFPEKAMLWLTAALCGLPIAASPFALKELV